MSETETLTAAHTPTVYFIDDSATMREVIKIAFRKENIRVITCPDAASALEQFGEAAPDAVITDVIMPDRDGYEVCQFVKQHEQFGKTPVILMSGVVNRTVAEKALAVKADELIRKPFEPRDLIVRVKNLLGLNSPGPASSEISPAALQGASRPAPQAATEAPPHTLASFFAPTPAHAPAAPAHRAAAPASAEVQKLRHEIRRLELLVKKLEAALEAERQYCAALEAHFKTLQESE
ncbi:MAG: two-component system response regulator [Candidatus Acidiferrales bacterium]